MRNQQLHAQKHLIAHMKVRTGKPTSRTASKNATSSGMVPNRLAPCLLSFPGVGFAANMVVTDSAREMAAFHGHFRPLKGILPQFFYFSTTSRLKITPALKLSTLLVAG